MLCECFKAIEGSKSKKMIEIHVCLSLKSGKRSLKEPNIIIEPREIIKLNEYNERKDHTCPFGWIDEGLVVTMVFCVVDSDVA